MGVAGCILFINLLQEMTTVPYRCVVIIILIAGKEHTSHVSLVIAMCLAETVDSLHTCCGIAAAKISCQGIGCIIIADCDHGVQIGVYRIPAVLSGYLIIILVDSSHDIELDQACSLHFLIINTALGSIYKIGYENSPGSVFSGKLTLNLF